ncbi:DUF4256 domain-containing protein [Emticicia sp. BO119]|uniref:DUF4256 domain-containing protein n=1 Tax=Emticicia sp. BO119 TaxID=2757768 RepID=UPI0015F0D87C|nr:DUF4256 domain-containing protein [Emticicia sp. BO119]MBA4853382.1 DUF4256 domain-containing protein [Emticicia sp. BO119]
MNKNKIELPPQEQTDLFKTLKTRFEKNIYRHKDLEWDKIQTKIESNPEKIWALNEMEMTGGEPDVIRYDDKSDEYIFCDCSPESPKGRRSICYDHEALEARKEHKPADSAINMASEMGIEILSEAEYKELQKIGNFDLKTSSWVQTPVEIRKLGGAIFCDRRYNQVFVYHNGADSYYAARGFRGILRV